MTLLLGRHYNAMYSVFFFVRSLDIRTMNFFLTRVSLILAIVGKPLQYYVHNFPLCSLDLRTINFFLTRAALLLAIIIGKPLLCYVRWFLFSCSRGLGDNVFLFDWRILDTGYCLEATLHSVYNLRPFKFHTICVVL